MVARTCIRAFIRKSGFPNEADTRELEYNPRVELKVNIPPIMPLAAPATTEVNGIWSVTDLPIDRLIARLNGS
jgi:hypothetical protein